jgi:hypothetical protein
MNVVIVAAGFWARIRNVSEESPRADKTLVQEGNLVQLKHDGFCQPMNTSREFKLLNSLYEMENALWVK